MGSKGKKSEHRGKQSRQSDDTEGEVVLDNTETHTESDDDVQQQNVTKVSPDVDAEEGNKEEDISSQTGDNENAEEGPAKPKRKRNRKKKTTSGEVSSAIQQAPERTPEDSSLSPGEVAKEKITNTVYIEGISYDADEGDLASHFSTCGTIKEIRMPRYQDSGKIRGYAHIVFDQSSGVEKALALDRSSLKNRYINVKMPLKPRVTTRSVLSGPKKRPKGCRTIFVKNLPYDITEQMLIDAFTPCGEIASVRLAMWNNTKKLKGFGYVTFKTESATELAGKKSGMRVGDRMVMIDYDDSAPKASFRTSEGVHWSKTSEAKVIRDERKSHTRDDGGKADSGNKHSSAKRSASGSYKPIKRPRL